MEVFAWVLTMLFAAAISVGAVLTVMVLGQFVVNVLRSGNECGAEDEVGKSIKQVWWLMACSIYYLSFQAGAYFDGKTIFLSFAMEIIVTVAFFVAVVIQVINYYWLIPKSQAKN